MDEATWLSCTDPTPLLERLRGTGKAFPRKLRLFAACWSPNPRLRSAKSLRQ
jgi:hypothetical protein